MVVVTLLESICSTRHVELDVACTLPRASKTLKRETEIFYDEAPRARARFSDFGRLLLKISYEFDFVTFYAFILILSLFRPSMHARETYTRRRFALLSCGGDNVCDFRECVAPAVLY